MEEYHISGASDRYYARHPDFKAIAGENVSDKISRKCNQNAGHNKCAEQAQEEIEEAKRSVSKASDNVSRK